MKNSNLIAKANNLTKIYNEGQDNEVIAVNNVSFEITEGEIITVMGPSGSGKTTLLNMISGIDEASSGEIYIAGENLVEMDDDSKTKYRAKNMGFIFQTFNLIPVLSAVENTEMPLLLNGIKKNEARRIASEMLERVGLGDRLHHKPNELSGGQRQRVTIARAIVHKPAVIWADEPTGNLDTKTANKVFELMLELAKEFNQTIVVVTHDENIADKTDRVIKMDSGELIRD
ncbi:MAG: ABC transporter ATP-binding protein [Candidatus Dojkabacteria bacterium]|nr:ABC transporter ATP-binding protein [Candidatus Dojkabacteria bacterium]